MHTNAYINAYNVYIILGGQVWPSKICQILLCKSGVWHSKFYLNLGRRLWNLQGTGQTCWRHCTVVQCYQNNWNHVHVCVHTHTHIYIIHIHIQSHMCVYIYFSASYCDFAWSILMIMFALQWSSIFHSRFS